MGILYEIERGDNMSTFLKISLIVMMMVAMIALAVDTAPSMYEIQQERQMRFDTLNGDRDVLRP
jgi:hypothetical protein